jgi:transposase
MRVLAPEGKDAIWEALEPRIPMHVDDHPFGCHRPRASDRDCFEVIVVRLATGCSWEDAERLTGNKVSDTTARAPGVTNGSRRGSLRPSIKKRSRATTY